jgi:hypothetical protein
MWVENFSFFYFTRQILILNNFGTLTQQEIRKSLLPRPKISFILAFKFYPQKVLF